MDVMFTKLKKDFWFLVWYVRSLKVATPFLDRDKGEDTVETAVPEIREIDKQT